MHILLGGYPPFCSSRQDKLFRLIKKGRVGFNDVSGRQTSNRLLTIALSRRRMRGLFKLDMQKFLWYRTVRNPTFSNDEI